MYGIFNAQLLLLSLSHKNANNKTGNSFLLLLTCAFSPNEFTLFTSLLHSVGIYIPTHGWRSSESTRLPPMWPGFDSRTRRHMWVEFVVGSRPFLREVFLRVLRFSLCSKTNISKFQFDLESEGHRFVSRQTVKCQPR